MLRWIILGAVECMVGGDEAMEHSRENSGRGLGLGGPFALVVYGQSKT